MPAIIAIKPDEGLTQEQAENLIGQGFSCFPKVSLAVGPKIALVGAPPTGVMIYDLWVGPPEPMMPQGFVASYLVYLAQNGEDLVTLTKLSSRFFKMNIEELAKNVRFSSDIGNPNNPDERANDQVGKDSPDTTLHVVRPPAKK